MSDRHRLRLDAEELLYREARLLDSWRLRDWLELFTDDARYVIPIRETLQGSPEGLHPLDQPVVHHVDEDRAGLELRVARIETGRAHAEEPRSRTRRLVSNVEVLAEEGAELLAEEGAELLVNSNLLLFQGRRDRSEFFFSAGRRDRLRRVDGQWRIASRQVLLDHTVLPRPLSQFL